MYTLFRLLFQKSYWRKLTLRATWFEAWLSLRRVHKDRRARKELRRLAFLLLVPLLCLVYLVWLLKSGAVFIAPFVIPVIWWIRRSNKRSEPLHIAPQPETPKPIELTDDQHDQICAWLGRFGLFYAVMLDRAGSELFVQNKELPATIEVVSRRIHIDLLRRTGIWDNLSGPDREAIMIPDGHWEKPLIQSVSVAMEPFRIMGWLLRADYYLPVIGKQTRADFGSVHEIVLTPEKLLESRKFVSPHGLEIALNGAKLYFYRCLAEAIHRGYRTAHAEDAARWASDYSARLAGQQNQDLTLGAKLVSEATQDEILWALSQSRARMAFLTQITQIIAEGRTPDTPFSLLEPEPVPIAEG